MNEISKMKRICYIFVLLIFISCSSSKKVVSNAFNDGETKKYQQAFQRSKDKFYALDSANAIVQDLGWAKRIVKEAKISENTIPTVFRRVNEESFTIELPCWESDSPKYKSASVVVEHSRLDSALVNAKIQGVDDIFRRSGINEKFSKNEQGELCLDSIEYIDSYADYISSAKFTCLCITKVKNKYIVNANIRISDEKANEDNPTLKFNEEKFREMQNTKWQEYLQQKDTINTEKAETPSE